MAQDLSDLPQIDVLLNKPHIAPLRDRFSHAETVAVLRRRVEAARAARLAGQSQVAPDYDSPSFADAVAAEIEAARAPSLRRVVNATGIIIHTNLGRARLAPAAVAAMQHAAAAPTNLELDLGTGKRGSRHAHVEALICQVTGAEAAVVVNNCAAAVLLSLMATAQGRKVIASRGELVEIGGSFRLPDVIDQSGAILKEVGTTNRTRIADYAAAIDDAAAVLLKSHTSNFRIVGFTAAADRRDLARLAGDHDLVMMEDLGGGVLVDLAPYGLKEEPVVSEVIRAGADLVMFSGDKLLGGPQAGIIAGRDAVISKLRTHPLMRAVRADKTSLAALEATLRLYLPPHDPLQQIPVLRMISEPERAVQARAQTLCASLATRSGLRAEVAPCVARVGGGTLPEQDLPSHAVTLSFDAQSAQKAADALRRCTTPVIGRTQKEAVHLDMRTVAPEELPLILAAIDEILLP